MKSLNPTASITKERYEKALVIVQQYEREKVERMMKKNRLIQNDCIDLYESELDFKAIRVIKNYLSDHCETEYELDFVPRKVLLKIDFKIIAKNKKIAKTTIAKIRKFKTHIKLYEEQLIIDKLNLVCPPPTPKIEPKIIPKIERRPIRKNGTPITNPSYKTMKEKLAMLREQIEN